MHTLEHWDYTCKAT